MNFITIYFCINFNFVGNDLIKKLYNNGPYAICIFFNKFIFMLLYIFHGLLKLNPSEFSQFWLFIVLITDGLYQ